jgi:hypothetical protein
MEFGFIDKTMRVQEQTKKHKDNFNKKEGILLSDNKQDEMMANVLDLYPKQTSYLLAGEGGAKKRTELQKEVRAYFNKLQDNDTALNANGRRKDRKGLKKVGEVIARGALAVPRGAGLALIRLNFRGFATRFNLLNSEGEDKIMKKWEQMGGKRDKLASAIEAGKDKKIIVCGKKCRAKAGANPKVPINIADEKLNVAGADDAVEVGTIAMGAGTLNALLGVVGTAVGAVGAGVNSKKNYKRQEDLMKLEADLKQKDNEENAIDATMTPSEKKIADEIIKAQNANNDPIQAIKNNTNLTADEKAEAIKQLEGIQKSNIGIDTNKKFILLGVLLIAGYLGWNYYKNQQTNS